MCGLAGFLSPDGLHGEEAVALARAMADRIVHRGPDDAGTWVDPDAGVALAHRRLSIVDLSPAGHQPMVSASGRYVLAFNGECYNHRDLRCDLEPRSVAWRGHSDTETLLEGIERWGVEATLERTVGMFAFALWDRSERSLTLARDRMGEKPLYYGWQGRTFLFGSELKALRVHPAFRGEVDRDVVALFLRHGYIPAPHAIYRGMRKLLPGTTLRLCAGQVCELPEPAPFWSLASSLARGRAAPFRGGVEEAADELERRLGEAVSLQRMADVPLGAFLSGGIDSSLTTALMQARADTPVRTFTIGFHESRFDEARYARSVAEHLGTDHTELYVTPDEALEVIPDLPRLYDEPFGDASGVPTHLVARLARRRVTVALSGDGGDELFFGYARYPHARRLLRRLERLPSPLRAVSSPALRAGVGAAGALGALVPPGPRIPRLRRKARRAAEILAADSRRVAYRCLLSHWTDPVSAVPGSSEPATVFTGEQPALDALETERLLMQLDQATILPGDILTKVDRAAMAVSLETRMPFLDHRVVEFSHSLPVGLLVDGGGGKAVVRRLLSRHLPTALFDRPKQGFSVPLGPWMRGPLREWAEDLLSPDRIRRDGILDERSVRRTWTEFLRSGASWEYQIWDVLMFQAWLGLEAP